MPSRKLSEADKQYIENNHDKKSVDELAEGMYGVGAKTVQAFIDSDIIPESKREDTPEERKEELQKKTGLTVGRLMGRDPERGIAVMTPQAAELSDVKRAPSGTDLTARNQSERIFKMDPKKRAR